MKPFRVLRSWAGMARAAKPGEARLLKLRCRLCGFPRLVRLYNGDSGTRCPACFGGTTHMSLATVLEQEVSDWSGKRVYELSTQGPLVRYLGGKAGAMLTCSEYWPDVPTGEWKDGFQCQNLESLTYTDNSFDVLTSTEVFEHVANDAAGFREAHRVLAPGGVMVFSVPLMLRRNTVERAVMENGEVRHLMEPEYHDDAIRGSNRVLAFRTYGHDIVERLLDAGFSEATINRSALGAFDGEGRAIVVARV